MIELIMQKNIKNNCYMTCKICGVNETNNPDGICDDCKVSIVGSDDFPPNF